VKKDEYFQFALEAFKPAETMLKMIPADKLGWKPGPSFMTMGHLIHHLSGGIGTGCAWWSTKAGPSPKKWRRL
jgi:hypothetical protein